MKKAMSKKAGVQSDPKAGAAAPGSHQPLIAAGSMPVPAPARTANHASKLSRKSAANTTAPSRLNTAQSPSRRSRSAYHAGLAKMHVGKLPIGVFKREADRPSDFGPAAADLRLRELEAVRLHDTYAVLSAGDRVQDRLASHLDQVLDLGARLAAIDVELEIDIGDGRLVEGVAG